MDTSAKGLNVKFPIYKADGTSFEDLVLHKSAFESVVMSLGDKITGDVYYKNNSLAVTMQEYIVYEGVHYVLVNPPTIVREGLVKDNSEAKGLTKYSFTFYHPMYMLGNFEFTDVAIPNSGQERYLAQNKTFSWIGYLRDFVDKLNANLANTQWIVRSNVSVNDDKLSEVLSFDNNFVSDALKTAYDTWKKPFVIDALQQGEYTYTDAHNNVIDYYDEGKRFVVVFGMPDERVMVDGEEYTFRLGQGVGLKNNSRTPKNNKIVTRISGYGSENNIPWGYPQIVWTGDQTWDYTINNDKDNPLSYPIYNGIVNGQQVRLIKHPFTRNHLMPSIYSQTVFNKVSPYLHDGTTNPNYNPQTPIIDYYDAIDNVYTDSQGNPITFPNNVDPQAPSYEIHQFEDIKPELGNNTTLAANAEPYTTSTEGGYLTKGEFEDFIDNEETGLIVKSNIEEEKTVLASLIPLPAEPTDSTEESIGGAYTYHYEIKVLDGYFLTVKYESSGVNFTKKVLYANDAPEPAWDDTMDDDGNYAQSYFKLTLPQLSFDLYACASITEEMKINMRSGACIGCTFPIMVDWEDYKKNFYDSDGNFDPTIGQGHPRNADKYPDSSQGSITVICQKEYETFGTIMPNVYQQPRQGDIIVFLGISLPQSYIEDAEERLDEASIEYMLENNVPLYEYSLKFDEYFLKNNLNILQQIHNNTRIKFQFGEEVPMALFVKQINIKWGDNILPQYDITLADDIEVVLNQIGQVTEDVSALRVQMSEIQKYYAQNLINDISSRLSRIQDDIALGKITFQQGLDSIGSIILHSDIRSNNYIQGMTVQGRGWRIDELGDAEVESIRVRSFMEVMELLVNRLQAQEGDTMFSDNDQIDYVEQIPYNNTMYYRLTFKEKWAGYFTSQVEGNILRGIANTLAANLAHVSDVEDTEDTEHDGRNSYFTSWMQVVEIPSGSGITLGNNQVLVVLYGDNQVPSGTNFEPCELMTVARWGSILDPNDPTINPEEEGITQEEKDRRLGEVARRKALQSSFYISTTEGRIVKLTGVNKPKLENGNYGTTLGELPDFVKNYPDIKDRIVEGGDYLYAQGIVVGDFIKIDKEGRPIINYVDKGEWQDNTPYLFGEFNEVTLQYETHEVWHNGALWRVKQHQPVTQGGVDTYYEPTDNNSAYWQKLMASGDSTRQIYSYSSSSPVVPQQYEQDDEYTPSGWSNTPLALSQQHKDVYISTKKKHNGTWGQWSTPALFSHLAEDGTSFNITGSALKHYDSWISMRDDTTKVAGGTYLCDEHYDGEDIVTAPAIVIWDGTSATSHKANVGDAYLSQDDGHVYQAIDILHNWEDLGQIKGDKGDDGKNTATVFIYKRSASQPTNTDKPTSTIAYSFADGSLSGNLNGWSAIIPQSDGNPCWVRQVFVSSDSPTVTIAPTSWSTANKYTEDGKDGVSIEAQYSPDAIQIHTTWQTGDLYMRTRATNEASWSDWQRIVGEDGANGDYTDYSFGISALLETDSPTTAPSDISTWADAPIGTTEQKPYLWSRVIKYVWVNGVKTVESTTYIRLTGEQGQQGIQGIQGEKGDQGDRGKVGRFFYFGGIFNPQDNDPTHGFVVNDAQAPYFLHINNGQKRFHVFNYGTNGSYTMAQMWAISNDWNNEPWEAMTNDFKYLISEALFGDYAHLGSFIISGDWMLSQYGTINGNASTSYTDFNNEHPNDNIGNNFIPKLAIDGLTGKVYLNDADIIGKITATSGEFRGKIVTNDITVVGGQFSNIVAQGGTFNNITAQGGTFAEISVTGMIRTPFQNISTNQLNFDNKNGYYAVTGNVTQIGFQQELAYEGMEMTILNMTNPNSLLTIVRVFVDYEEDLDNSFFYKGTKVRYVRLAKGHHITIKAIRRKMIFPNSAYDNCIWVIMNDSEFDLGTYGSGTYNKAAISKT